MPTRYILSQCIRYISSELVEIFLAGHSIVTSHNVTCLGVVIDAELTFATHVKRVASRSFYQLRQLWSVRPVLSADNARMLAHAFIASRVDYCNSILYQTAAVHLRPLQLVLNAAAHLVVKKRKWGSITPTIRDNRHWLLVQQRVDFKLILLVYKWLHKLANPYLHRQPDGEILPLLC